MQAIIILEIYCKMFNLTGLIEFLKLYREIGKFKKNLAVNNKAAV